MPNGHYSTGTELGKKTIRFAVSIVGLLLLRGLFNVLPMMKNASPIGSTFLSPLVLANAIVDTLILIALVGFGFALSRSLRGLYPRVPDLATAALLAVFLLALVLAYNLYELPIACTVISPQDVFASQGSAQARTLGGQLGVGDMFNQIAKGMSEQLAQILKNMSGDALVAYQKLAVAKLREPPDLYGWIFLLLCAVPVVGIVLLGSRNLDAMSELLFHKATTASSNWQQGGAFARNPQSVRAGKELSPEDMDKLVRLKSLLDAGTITQGDFDAQKRRILQQEPVIAEEPAELQKLKQLLDAGALTQEEYDAQKQRFLARL